MLLHRKIAFFLLNHNKIVIEEYNCFLTSPYVKAVVFIDLVINTYREFIVHSLVNSTKSLVFSI